LMLIYDQVMVDASMHEIVGGSSTEWRHKSVHSARQIRSRRYCDGRCTDTRCVRYALNCFKLIVKRLEVTLSVYRKNQVDSETGHMSGWGQCYH
jgi:hypothetical protein